MKTLSSTRLAYRQSRTGVSCKGMIWITAKDRTTGVAQRIGLWTGDDHQVFTINSVGRTYYGAGSALSIDDTISQVGVQVRTRTIVLSGLSPEVQQAVKGYDARLGPVELHRAEFDTATGVLIEEPERIFKGFIDKVVWSTPAVGGEATCTLTLVSIARALTRSLTQRFSDAAQRLRNPSDAFFQYTDVTTAADVWWGEQRVSATSVGAPSVVPSKFVNEG